MKRLNLRHDKEVLAPNHFRHTKSKSIFDDIVPDTFTVYDNTGDNPDEEGYDEDFKHKIFDVLSYLNHAHNHNKINNELRTFTAASNVYTSTPTQYQIRHNRAGTGGRLNASTLFSERDMPAILHGIGKFYQHHLKNKLNDYIKQHSHLYDDDKPTLGILHDKYKDEGRHDEYINKLHGFLDSYPELIQGFMKHRIDNPHLYEPVERTEDQAIKDDERYPIFSKKEGQQQRDLYKYITEHHPSTKNDEMAGDYAHHVTGIY